MMKPNFLSLSKFINSVLTTWLIEINQTNNGSLIFYLRDNMEGCSLRFLKLTKIAAGKLSSDSASVKMIEI